MPITNDRSTEFLSTVLSCLLTFGLVAVSFATENKLTASAPKNRCPVCGMFVSMFADWNATIVFDDATRAIFDGPKDMFKYYHDRNKYHPSKSGDVMAAILVKDYYSKSDIDARKAFFVIWSDVYGPMGHEPISFEKEADARKFLNEHAGKKILRFEDITPKVILSLDNPE